MHFSSVNTRLCTFIYGDSYILNSESLVLSHILYNCSQTSEDGDDEEDSDRSKTHSPPGRCWMLPWRQQLKVLLKCKKKKKKKKEKNTRINLLVCKHLDSVWCQRLLSLSPHLWSSTTFSLKGWVPVHIQQMSLHRWQFFTKLQREIALMFILFNHHRITGCTAAAAGQPLKALGNVICISLQHS